MGPLKIMKDMKRIKNGTTKTDGYCFRRWRISKASLVPGHNNFDLSKVNSSLEFEVRAWRQNKEKKINERQSYVLKPGSNLTGKLQIWTKPSSVIEMISYHLRYQGKHPKQPKFSLDYRTAATSKKLEVVQ